MATQRQKKVARLIVKNSELDEPLNAGEMLEKVGYSPHLVKQPGRVIESDGVQEELEALGFTEKNAMSVVAEIMMNSEADNSSRLKATDQVFKVKGSYAPEKKDITTQGEKLQSDIDLDDFATKLAQQLKEEMT